MVGASCAGVLLGSCREAPGRDVGRDVATGRILYAANGCGVCHGPQGRGDGALASTLTPRPRDFTDTESFKRSRTAQALADVIAQGLPGTPSSMPAYAHLTEEERRQLARFVLSLGGDATARTTR